MKTQLEEMGFDFDWDRELSTCDPNYYKHTQQIFEAMRKSGLAYQDETFVNWDPVDQTVLANEQIDSEGRSWRSGAKVQKRTMKQWYFDIRKYAEEMLQGVEEGGGLDGWPKAVKESQKGWIGREHGKIVPGEINGHKIKVFISLNDLKNLKNAQFLAINYEINK